MSSGGNSSKRDDSWNLIPLTPEYVENEHRGYVAAIEEALENTQIRNIALSGSYGVGKSSILRELARRLGGRVVELSLSTLAPIEVSKLDDSLPLQATTPTNRIQQEIVKQLLYRQDPSKTPASRFRRIERFRWRREFGTAVLLGVAVAIVFLLTGWTAEIAATFTVLGDLGVWAHLIVVGVAAAAALAVRWLSHGKLRIKQFSAGAATVTLDENSMSYFDQYLDEILYSFDVSSRDVVIFEDIDRFNDSHIFETLRALNTLLNASPQIEKPIRFIYAIKDSIFDRIGLEAEGRKLETGLLAIEDPARAEAVRTNRTKFFDLVIPVVPFITHRSARNLAVQLLGEIEHKVAPELLDLAAQYVPDMRLLKNVRNEFIVFRDRIFSGDGKQLKLSETDLFAMMLYKGTHLTDFETIRLGTSNLDTLYQASRELVTANIKRIEGERRALRTRLARLDADSPRSAQMGGRLLEHVQRTMEAAGYQAQGATYTLDGQSKSSSDLKSVEFWNEFASADGDSVLRWRNGTYGQALSFTRTSISAALGDALDPESWAESDRDDLTDQIVAKTVDLNFLRGADLGDLLGRPEFLVKYEEVGVSLAALARKLLKPGLAYQLVRAGYINRNFTLYTSTFHGDRVSPSATNFIIHHVERDLMDEYFQLEPEDVDAVVRERGKSALKEPALYNIAILDRLLATDPDAADIMTQSLDGLGESQMRFLQAYLTAGAQRLQFTARFTAVSSRFLQYLVSQADLEEASRMELVSVALAHLPSTKQRSDPSVREYLAAHYGEFPALTSDTMTPTQAMYVADLYAVSGINVAQLAPLGQHVRSAFVSRSLYEITRANLAVATNHPSSLALDVIRATSGTVYDHVLAHLSTYLAEIEGEFATVDVNENFLAVIEDVLEHGEPHLGAIVEHAAPTCTVADLAEVSERAWPVLAEHRRIPASFDNVNSYVVTIGAVDAHIGKTLAAAGSIAVSPSSDEESKVVLALAILSARENLPSSSLRAELVESLNLEEYLDATRVSAEPGDLFALLRKHDIVADDAETYAQLASVDWDTRKAFIRESKEFANYVTPELVGPDLASLLGSDQISTGIKGAIVTESAEYAAVADASGLEELARYAVQHGHGVPPDVVQSMAQAGVRAPSIIALLEPHLSDIGSTQLGTAPGLVDV